MTPKELIAHAQQVEHDHCILWPFSQVNGYPKAKVAGRTVRVHMLSCETACGRRPTKRHEAGHRCGQSLCINPNHLRWVTRRQNERDKRVNGTAPRGERNAMAKLTAAQAVTIRRRYRKGRVSQASLAVEYGVSATTIGRIIKRETWRNPIKNHINSEERAA